MKTFFFSAFILFNASWANAADFAQELCGEEYTTATPVKDWYGDEKNFCRKAYCKNDVVEVDRERCVKPSKDQENIIMIVTEDQVKGHDVMGYKGKADFVYIEDGDMCFEACKPAEEKKLFGKKIVSGLSRKSCVECFKNRKGNYENSFEYKEVGKRLFPNQKCYFACRDPKGPIVTSRKLTTECEQCVGLNGHPGEYFQHLVDKDGQCYEIDSNNRRWSVPYFFCGKNKNIMTTTFEFASSYTVRTLLFKEKPQCKEIDVQTGGQIFSRVVGSSFCESENKNNSDRTIIPDKSNPSKSKSKSGNSATKQ